MSGISTHLAVDEVHRDVPAHGAAGVAAAVDTCLDDARVDIDHGVGDTGFVTAAKHFASDISAGIGGHGVIGREGCRNGSDVTRHGIDITDVDCRVSRDSSEIAATEHIAFDTVGLCDVHHIDHGTSDGWIGGSISGFVAGTIDVGDIETAVSGLKVEHVDGDAASDITVFVASAEGIEHGATKKVKGDVAADIGGHCCKPCGCGYAFRAAENVSVGTTIDVESDIADDIGLVGTTVETAYFVVAAA